MVSDKASVRSHGPKIGAVLILVLMEYGLGLIGDVKAVVLSTNES